MMVLGLDDPMSEEVLRQIRDIPNIDKVEVIVL